MKVTTLNCNGLRSADRRGLRRWLRRSQPDVLCLQEIRCDLAVLPEALRRPRGWRAAFYPAKQKGYAGTALWTRLDQVEFTRGTGHSRGDDEGRLLGANLGAIDIYSLYVPAGSSGPERQAWKLEYLGHMETWLAQLAASGRPALVCGDLNIAHRPIDLKNWRSNQKNSGFLPEERAWLDRVLGLGFRDAFRELNPDAVAYSWWSNRGRAREKDIGWRLDYVLSSPGIKLVRAAIERDAEVSDHAPVSLWLEL